MSRVVLMLMMLVCACRVMARDVDTLAVEKGECGGEYGYAGYDGCEQFDLDTVLNDQCRSDVYSFNYEGYGPHGYMDELEIIKDDGEPLDLGWMRDVMKVLVYVILAVIIVVGVVLLIKYFPRWRRAGRRGENADEAAEAAEDVTFDSEKIFGHDYEKEIAAALAKADFSRAVRLAYLTTLEALHKRRVVECKESKTAGEYYAEAESAKPQVGEPFYKLTTGFLSASYGPTEPEEEDFRRADTLRGEVIKLISNGVKCLVFMVMLTSCSMKESWTYFHDDSINIAMSAQFGGLRHVVLLEDSVDKVVKFTDNDLVLEHFMGYYGTAEHEYVMLADDIVRRMVIGQNTFIAAERAYVRYSDGGEEASMIVGEGYIQDSLVADVRDDGELRLSKIRYRSEDYDFPAVFSNCRLDMEQLRRLESHVREMAARRVTSEVIATIDGEPVAWRLSLGRRTSLVVTSVPILFTNYGMTYNEGRWNPLIFALLSDAGFKKVGVRYSADIYQAVADSAEEYPAEVVDAEEYVAEGEETSGEVVSKVVCKCKIYGDDYSKRNEFKIYESESSKIVRKTVAQSDDEADGDTWWQYVLLAFLLMLPWLVRRRQRVIPIIEAPVNKTTELIRHAAAVYEHQGDYENLVQKRAAVFYAFMKHRYDIDLAAEGASGKVIDEVVHLTSLSRYEIYSTLTKLHEVMRGRKQGLVAADAMSMVDHIERIESALASQ